MRKTLTAALLVCFAASARAEEAKPSPFTFALHGFVSMSGYMQDGVTGLSDGQQSLFAAPPKLTSDKYSMGFDIRQSRFNFSVKGPQVFGGATPAAVLELDFFQGFGGGAYGNVSLLNRLRFAYSELNWGNHRLAFGQMNDLFFAQAPYSISHIAFPLGFGTGNVGWRRPGIFGYHTLPAGDMKLEFAWEVGRSQWADGAAVYTAATTPGSNTTASIGNNTYNAPAGLSLGEASNLPAVEARLTLTSKAFTVWAAGHWNRVDMNGVGTGGGVDNLDVVAGGGGLKILAGPLTLAGCGFYGKNTGPLVGNLIQFSPGGVSGAALGAGPTTVQDVKAYGWWGQAGVNLTKEFSVWGFYGMQKPKEAEAKAAGFTRLQNDVINVMAQYRDGGYAVSGEWINFKTKTASYDATTKLFASSTDLKTNQYMLTATYFF